METKQSKIDWKKYSDLTKLLQTSSIMAGEEKELTPDEVEAINNHITDMMDHAEQLKKLFSFATHRAYSKPQKVKVPAYRRK